MTATVDKSDQRVRQMFGEISPKYDLLNRCLSGGTDRYWRWRTVRTVKPEGDAPILDICTGTGDLAISYWKKAKGKVPVVGSDFTHEMLARAIPKGAKTVSKRSKQQPAPLTFLEADAQNLPFVSDSFQIVSVAFGLRNIADTRQGLREMIRVCRPGGRVVILEFSMPRNRVIRGVYSWYFKRVLPKVGQWVSGSKQAAYNYLPDSVSEFPHGEALAEIMRECGLTEVKFRPLTFGIATLYYGRK